MSPRRPTEAPAPATAISPGSLLMCPAAVLRLQRMIGNQATVALIQAGKSKGPLADGFLIRGLAEDEVDEAEGESEPRAGGRHAPVSVSAESGPTVQRVPPVPVLRPRALTKSTVSGPTANPRGGFKWVIQWKLDQPSPAGGYVVQGVNIAGKVTNAATGAPVLTGWETYVPYWEAWRVNAGQKVTSYAEGGDLEDDTFANPSYPAGTKGTVTEAGRADFYENLTLPASFASGNVTPAGILESTNTDPGHMRGATAAISHNLTATWDCSTGSDDTTVTTI